MVLLGLLAGGSVAQGGLTDRYIMTQLDLTTGLPHNNVNQIFADSRGFVWISTYGGGAVRYDGYSFTMPVLNRQTRMTSNSCKGFAEDRHQRLWVAFDEGTVVVDMRTMDCVVPVLREEGKVKSEKLATALDRRLMQSSVKVYCDSRGALWQVTRDSIFRYTFDETGCDAVMIGRGALGRPWIFDEIVSGKSEEVTPETVRRAAMEQLSFEIEDKGEYTAIREMKKHFAWYVKGRRNAALLRNEAFAAGSIGDFLAILGKLE